ncbi:MAG: hypothetical protein KDD53_12930, partial [Bdellovibrionales bacterium]|nr:hypothetical protein [Bdellovibrionales bacterium]
LCDGSKPNAASWVLRFGQWIDIHGPRDVGGKFGAKFDRYHPSVDSALSSKECSLTQLRVGYWDDRGAISRLEVYKISDGEESSIADLKGTFPNGFQLINLPSGLNNEDIIKIIATDIPVDVGLASGEKSANRQMYEKSVDDLLFECTGNPPGSSEPQDIDDGDSSNSDKSDSTQTFDLALNDSSFYPGKMMQFTLGLSDPKTNLPLEGTWAVLCSASGTSPGTEFGPFLNLDLNQDLYFDKTAINFVGDSSLPVLSVMIPDNLDDSVYTKQFNCQALLAPTKGAYRKSNLVNFNITPKAS